MKKIMLILCLFICLLFSISSVFSAELNDGQFGSDNNILIESDNEISEIIDENLEDTGDDVDLILSADSDNTFHALNDTINGNSDSEIDLTKDYYFDKEGDDDFRSGIQINRNVIINGNNHTINAQKSASIFQIFADNVVIRNITFMNSYYNALYMGGNNGIVSDCNFTNNHDPNYGGAILWDGSNGSVYNCIFEKNHQDNGWKENGGGAIYWTGDDGSLSNCSFIDNRAEYHGGAVRWTGRNGNISNCIFKGSYTGYGGAIYFSVGASGNISYCTFTGNKAGYNAGAIYLDGSGYVHDNLFENNSGNSNGGVIYICTKEYIISRNVFVNNSGYRGILTAGWSSLYGLEINNNILLNNSVKEGKIIELVWGDENVNIGYNWFGNNATDYNIQPSSIVGVSDVWLFLNASANPEPLFISDISEIFFRLYAYNLTSNTVSDYDNTLLKPINLTITPTNGKTDKSVVNLDEKITYTVTSGGIGSVTATIKNATYALEFKIKYDSNLIVESLETMYSENTILTLVYNSTATGKVNITLNGKKLNMTFNDLDLKTSISLGDILPDEYNVTVAYSGDDNFSNATASAKLTINKMKTNITADAMTTVYNRDDYLIIALKDINGKPINGAKLTVDLNGIANYTTDADGIIKISTKSLDAGNHTAMITFNETERYVGLNTTTNVTVLKASAKVSSNGLTAIYQENKYLKGRITDADGNPIVVDYVNITINGVTYPCKLDKNGNAQLIIRLKPKTYTATITFDNNNYTKTTINTKVTVKKATPKLIAKKKTFKKSKKVKKYKITLKDNRGKAIKKAKLILKIKGKTFKAKTNSKGKATFKIKKLMKKGKFKAKIKFKGNEYFKAVSKKVKIKNK